jgi:hypothetical protein
MIFAANLVPVGARSIVGLVDIGIVDEKLGLVFEQRRWRVDELGERLEHPDGPFLFWRDGEAQRFQKLALAAVHAEARRLCKRLAPSHPLRKLGL